MISPAQLAKSGSEDAEQMALFAWCALNFKQYPQLKWMHAIPNGGYRNKAEAAKLVATGVRKGVFDVFLPVMKWEAPRLISKYGGLYIELKKRGREKEKAGGMSEAQQEFMTYANLAGYKAVVCYGWEEAVAAIEEYLKCGGC